MHVRHAQRHAISPSSATPQGALGTGTAINPPGWDNIPQINQLHPDGAGRGYDGSKDCAPAVVAMLARAMGTGGNTTDAALIKQLGQGLVGPDGTKPQDMPQMLERAGLPITGKALAGRYSDADVAQHLQQGHTLIAQVEARDSRGTTSSHYVAVQGMTAEGNYIVSDPLAEAPYELSPQQLRSRIRGAPPDGGMLIPVGAPPGGPGGAAFPGASDTFQAANAKPIHNTLDIKYGDREPRGGKAGKKADVAPQRLNANQYSRRVMQMKQNNPEQAEQVLGKLEVSRDRKDKAVLRRVEAADVRQPGIGKKTTGEGFSE
jgi:hypothetical protein